MSKKCLFVVYENSDARSMANLGFKIHAALREGYEVIVRSSEQHVSGSSADVIWHDEQADAGPFGFAS